MKHLREAGCEFNLHLSMIKNKDIIMKLYKIISIVFLVFLLFSCGNTGKDGNTNTIIEENDQKNESNEAVKKDEIKIERLPEVEELDLPKIERKEFSQEDLKLIEKIQKNYNIEIRKSSNYLYVSIENKNKEKRKIDSKAVDSLLILSMNILDLKIGENIIITDEDYLKFTYFKKLQSFRDFSGNLNDQNSSFLEKMNYLQDANIKSNEIGLETMKRLSSMKYLDKIQITTDLKNPNILKGLNNSKSIKIIGLITSKNVEKSVLDVILSLNLPNLELVILPEENSTVITRDDALYYNNLFLKRFPKFDYVGHIEDPISAND